MQRKMRKVGLFFLLSATGTLSVWGQKVTIDAEIRPRVEFREGFNQPLADTLAGAGFMLQRTRLGFNYESNSLNARICLQDARTFGETDTKSPSSVGIYEAWAELLLLQGTSFKVGRQGIQFEDGRLFSLSPWSNTGNSHDLVQFKYNLFDFSAELGYAFNNNKTNYNADSSFYAISKMYRQLNFLHLTKPIFKGLTLSALGVDESFQKSKKDLRLYHRYTTGGTLTFKNDSLPFTVFLTGYYQFGRNTATVDLEATLLAAKAIYKANKWLGLNAGVDYYSGSKTTINTTKETNTFQKLYGVNHAFNGYMEYWAALPSGGLVNYYGGITLTANEKLSADINYFTFRTAEKMQVKVKTVLTDVPFDIGSELDLVLNYKMSPETSIQAGWCTYFMNRGAELLKFKSIDTKYFFPQYAYLMFTFKPKLYTQK